MGFEQGDGLGILGQAPRRPTVRWAPRYYVPPRPFGVLAAIGIAVVTLADCLLTGHVVRSSLRIVDYLSGRSELSQDASDSITRTSAHLLLLEVILLVAAGILFVLWLWIVRRNAQFFSDARHRRARGWILFCWFVPVANLFVPAQLLEDVVATSDRGFPPRGGWVGKGDQTSAPAKWWTALLVSRPLSLIGLLLFDAPTTFSVYGWAAVCVLCSAALIFSAYYGVRMISHIDTAQSTRPRIPWRDQDNAKAPPANQRG